MEIWDKWEANYKKLEAVDEAAKKKGILIGRLILHPTADGNAVYKIISETTRTVKVQVCTGIGDDWVLPAWGAEASIPKKTALVFINRRDRMKEIFS